MSLPEIIFTPNIIPKATKGIMINAILLALPFRLNTLIAPAQRPIIKLPNT